MQSGWKSYFIFSKKEQRGIMVLGLILLSTMLMGILFPRKETEITNKSKKNYYEKSNARETNTRETNTSLPIGPLFYFDPNTIDSQSAIQLGIPNRQVVTLLRYRNKGGRFYHKEDMAKLYGLKKELVEKLIPYVVIQNIEKSYSKQLPYVYKTLPNSHLRNGAIAKKVYDEKKKVYDEEKQWSIDINTSDEKQWAVKTKLSPAIIQNMMRYRNYLGGFTNLNQIKKVYGFTESDYYLLKPHLKLGKMNKHKLNASTMSFENWKAIGIFQDREIAQILRIRKQNGGYIGWKEIVLLFDLTKEQAEILQNTININK
jgi:DNA uptake protein ComE-like DNA-binding protein